MSKPKSTSPEPADLLVVNTGPLIALSKGEALEVVGQLPVQLVCPPEVRAELDAGVGKGLSEVKPSWLEVRPLERPLDLVARATLDPGETAVIQLALEQGIRRVCIDERRGRRAASSVGLEVVGSLGLLLRAKNLQIIPAVRPYVERICRAGDWYSQALIEAYFKAADETDEGTPSDG